jgi:hypothetical protein
MKLNYLKTSGLSATIALALLGFVASMQAAALSDQNKQFLAAYGKAHDALVADDLAGAQKSAADPGGPGSDVERSSWIEEARSAFENFSDRAVNGGTSPAASPAGNPSASAADQKQDQHQHPNGHEHPH